MKKIIKIFLTGVTAILPFWLTTFIIYKTFLFIDGITASIFEGIFGYPILGLGFLTTILIIFLIGLTAKNVLGQKILKFIDCIFDRLPIAKKIYLAIKEISSNLFSGSKNSFKQPVMLDYPTKGIKSIGFITNDNVSFKEQDVILVFIPTTPNPTNGFLVFVEKEKVEYLDISVDEAMKTIISLGTIAPSKIN